MNISIGLDKGMNEKNHTDPDTTRRQNEQCIQLGDLHCNSSGVFVSTSNIRRGAIKGFGQTPEVARSRMQSLLATARYISELKLGEDATYAKR